MVEKVTDDLIGKRISCKIYNHIVTNAQIVKEEGKYYILNNHKHCSGSRPNDYSLIKDWKYSWSVGSGDKTALSSNAVSNIELLLEGYELW